VCGICAKYEQRAFAPAALYGSRKTAAERKKTVAFIMPLFFCACFYRALAARGKRRAERIN